MSIDTNEDNDTSLKTNTYWKIFHGENFLLRISVRLNLEKIFMKENVLVVILHMLLLPLLIMVSNTTLQEKCISVNRNGSVGYSFYHSYPALFGNDTRKLIPKYNNDHVAKFISFMISSQKEKYSYGYKMGIINKSNLSQETLL